MTVDASRRNPRELWHAVNNMLQPPKEESTPKLTSVDFARFFRDKVDNIRKATAEASPPVIGNRCFPPLSSFEPTAEHEIVTLLQTVPSKSCLLDPISTWLPKCLSPCIAPVICHLCNLSMHTGFLPQLKQACILPLLKKPTLDPDTCSSYRPISNLSFISKLIECIVVRHFTSHVSQFNLFPSQQSAYRPFHSTETGVLSVHDALVRNNQVLSLIHI